MKTVILLDAFKEEYLKYAPYLNSLTKHYQHGSLETPLGFWGAMDTFFNGKSNVLSFFYYTEDSSWKWIKYFTWLGRFSVDVLINLWNLFHSYTLFRTNNIPLNKLYLYDTEIKKPIHKIKGIKYITFHKLDGLTHKYGTKSKEVRKYVKELDKKIKNLKWDIILSDHGFMDVKEFIKVPETEKCFIDSTLARYWGEKPNMPLDKCKLIQWDKKYGDYIYLANPSVVFLPNYWEIKKVKAMHGYDPKLKDMKAFYIIKKHGKRKDLSMKELSNGKIGD